MKWFFLLPIATLALLCLAGQRAQADQLTSAAPNWSYSFAITPKSIRATPSGSGAIQFDGTSNVKMDVNNAIQVGLGSLVISAVDSTIATIPRGQLWTGALTLSDTSGMSTPLTLQSTVSGTFSSSSLDVVNTPLQLVSTKLPAGWSIDFASNGNTDYVWKSPRGNTYTVSRPDVYMIPPPPGGVTSSLHSIYHRYISTNIQVQESGNGATATPEPSALVLLCVGLGLAGLASWCQRRRALATQLG
jgi:hypothetical protein